MNVVIVVVFTLKTVLTSIVPFSSYSSRQRNEFPWSQANPKVDENNAYNSIIVDKAHSKRSHILCAAVCRLTSDVRPCKGSWKHSTFLLGR